MNALEVRQRILETVSKNGGHLASSLGAVEIAMALREVFDPERDRVVWDVGHQAYAWKLLTGRWDEFPTLRKMGGISGFPNPKESKADAAIAGHAGVALSVAEGLAAARDRKGTDENVVAVIGDAAIANGTSFEALNNCAAATRRIIVVLNDNDMSIAKPTGSFARTLGRLTSGVRYNRVKNAAKKAGRALRLSFLYGFVHWVKNRLKTMMLKNVWFEEFGFHYLGPVDGHDLAALVSALTAAKEEMRPVLLHVVTKKGRGYGPAEKNPTAWHGVGPFAYPPGPDTVDLALPTDAPPAAKAPTWSEAFGAALSELAREDNRVVALTAAMRDGTGLAPFAAEFPGRFFDVGIAEGHMIAFAGGLAAGGMRPVVAIYSTFLQRAVDQVMHDVSIANLPVVICVDRAGVVGADGVTHQGLYDIAMLRCLPNLTICQPKDAEDLKALLVEALGRNGPTVIRYPRGKAGGVKPSVNPSINQSVNPSIAIWATGDWYGRACEVAERVGGVAVHARYLKPFDAKMLAEQRAKGMKIVSLENGAVAGGLGEAIGADVKFGWPDEFIPHGTCAELERRYGLDVESIVKRLSAEF
ncbi:MAG: 1-deoxy-D-xylulose-5-phosphate synthase [Kiritimatiellae bacterium]|nr:1-deoxy-D-xylulose-5-phosphate synthase [Kiritimatiellia bacterium]